MNPIAIPILILSLLLAGCNSEQSDSIEPQTAQLLDLNITGLGYSTDTQSGTLVDGTYQFIEGETLVLTLFGQPLAEFDASQGMLSADFPDNEDDFAAAFFDGEDFVSFRQVANLVQLLANLDNNTNLDDGFDLSAYSEQNAITTEIDLTIAPDLFYEQTLVALANELSTTRAVTPMVSVSYLYESTGQNMEYYLLDSYISDSDNDGLADKSSEYFYTNQGYKERVAVKDDQNLVTDEYVYEYDEMGRQTAQRFPKYNTSGVRTFERGDEYTFNSLGQVASNTDYFDYNGDGVVDSATTEHYSYDSKGRLEVETQERSNGDTVELTYSYYDDGSVSTVTELEYDDEKLLDSQQLTTYSYNAEGLVTAKRVDTDIDADGSYDFYDIQSKTYNANNDLLTWSNQSYTVGGVLDSELLHDYDYDANGYLIGYSYWSDYDADSVINYRSQVTYTVNESGETTNSFSEVYSDGTNLSSTTRYVFHRPELSYQGEYSRYDDDDGDGIEDSKRYLLQSYDQAGKLSQSFTQYDDDNDGTVDSEDLSTYSYYAVNNGVAAYLSNVYASRN